LIDCDPGIDDALAILLALGEKSVNLKAITTEAGNVGISQTTKNLLGILKLSGLNTFPNVGKGEEKPLTNKALEARDVHGQDGLGNVNIGFALPDIEVRDGVSLIVSEILSGRIDSLIATGPLTNIARAIEKEGSIRDKLNSLFIMGGALRVRGNVTKFAEFNFFCDPEAAKIVLSSGIPISLVSLDVTEEVILTKDRIAGLGDKKSPITNFILQIIDYSIDYHKRERSLQGAYIHDALTVGLAIDESLGQFEELCVDVKLTGEERGRLFIKEGKPNVLFCKNVNSEKFLDFFLSRLEGLIRRC